MRSKIEWTDTVWNPTVGCSRISTGCENCYAERLAGARLRYQTNYEGLTRMTPSGPVWTGEVRLLSDKLEAPLHWRKPRMIFVNSMSDLFHENVPVEFIERVFDIMSQTPRHTYQVLTKRIERMKEVLYDLPIKRYDGHGGTWWWSDKPLPNVWIGVSVEDQQRADERIPELLQIPAVVRFLSVEPLLGPIDLLDWIGALWECPECGYDWREAGRTKWFGTFALCPLCRHRVELKELGVGISWCIVGAESGPRARPMNEDWVKTLLRDCKLLDVPFFYKQKVVNGRKVSMPELDGQIWNQMPLETGV